jgi:transcriptional regulator with XRE-family HTH domain
LGKRVRRLREERALTQSELADLSGVSLSTVSRLEQTSLPVRAGTIRKLARALDVKPIVLTTAEPAQHRPHEIAPHWLQQPGHDRPDRS